MTAEQKEIARLRSLLEGIETRAAALLDQEEWIGRFSCDGYLRNLTTEIRDLAALREKEF